MVKDTIKHDLDPIIREFCSGGPLSAEERGRVKDLFERLTKPLIGHGKFMLGRYPGSLVLYSNLDALCGVNKIPQSLRPPEGTNVRITSYRLDQFYEMVAWLESLVCTDLSTSWGKARTRQWISDRYTSHHTTRELSWIDPALNRILELFWLMGARTDVACEGHPSGCYFRILEFTPVVRDALEWIASEEGWTVEPSGALLPHAKVVSMTQTMKSYAERNALIERTVEQLEERYGIGTEQVPPSQFGLWLVNRT